MSDAAVTEPEAENASGFDGDEGGFTGRALAWVEKAGNKVPNPAILFVALCVGVILLSQALAATAFLSVGRNPPAGIAAGFGAVSAAFGVNVLITPADGVLTDLTNESAKLVDPSVSTDLAANLYFGIGCTIFLTIVIALITSRVIEPRLGKWDRSQADEEELAREEGPPINPRAEAKGLRWALYALLAVLVLILALTLPPGAPLRNPETGDIIGDSPFMSSLIVMISLAFGAAGVAFGRAVGTVKTSDDALGMITKSMAGSIVARLRGEA
jgi:aminobenzoyl-glutamate transport protein